VIPLQLYVSPVAAAVVVTVNVAFPLPLVPIVTGFVLPKLNVGGSTAFAGFEVICAVRETCPVNPPAADTIIGD
jgi:hypothetical protein